MTFAGGGGNDRGFYNADNTSLDPPPFVPGILFDGGEGDDNNFSVGSRGEHTVVGGAGNDRISLLDPSIGDLIDGGDGLDKVTLTWINTSPGGLKIDASNVDPVNGGSIYLNDDLLNPIAVNVENLEQVQGGIGDDIIIGDPGRNAINGRQGEDSLYGMGGNDKLELLEVSAGDFLDGGDGFDSFRYIIQEGGEIFDGRALDGVSPETITVSGVTIDALNLERLEVEGPTGSGDVTFYGGDATDDIYYSNGTGIDVAYGGGGNDFLYQFYGDLDTGDIFDGGAGTSDILTLNNRFSFAPSAVTIDGSTDGSLTVNGVTFTVLNIENFNFSGSNDSAVGDLVTGTAFNDQASLGAGDDIFNGGEGNDTGNGFDGNDTLNGEDGNDGLNGMNGNDTLNGGAGNDFLSGGDGDDILNGGADQDTMRGNAGNDRFVLEPGADRNFIFDFEGGAGVGDVVDVSAYGFFDGFDTGTNRIIDHLAPNGTSQVKLTLPGGDELFFYTNSSIGGVGDFAADDFVW